MVMTARRKKTDGTANKAQLIRDAFKVHGINAPAKDIQTFTEEKGAKVAAAQISNIRTKMKNGRKKGSNGHVTADELIKARTLADGIGGVGRAKELLDILERLS